MTWGRYIAYARRELHRRRDAAIAAAEQQSVEELSPGQKATITKRLHRQVAGEYGFGSRIPLPPREMFSGAQGTGKTTVARQFSGTSPGLVTWVTELTFEKSREEFDAYRRDAGPGSPPAMLIRGRSRPDPARPGHFMCDRHKAAERVAGAGLSVIEALCMTCEFRGHCGDNRQRGEANELAKAGKGAVFYQDAEYAFLPSPAPAPDHAILDETLLQRATDIRYVPLTDLTGLTVPNLDTTSADTATTLHAIVDAFTALHPTTPARVAGGDDRTIPRPLAYLRHAGIDRKALRYLAKAARAELDRQTPKLNANMAGTNETPSWYA